MSDASQSYSVVIEEAAPIQIAAVRARCAIPDIPRAFKAPLDQVWAFLRARPALHPGHNVFLYHHPGRGGDTMEIDFGVAVTDAFSGEDPVRAVATPGGRVAMAVHRGAYAAMKAAHVAIHAYCAAHGHAIGSASWEIYGDWTEDEAALETTIVYLIA